MATIKIPSPSTILDSTDPAPESTRGKPTSFRKAKVTTQKPKQTKSRNGCITCKAKRLKCDETKPSCHQCERRKVTCGGYKKDFKWRPFEETNLAVGRPTTKPKQENPSHPPFALPNHDHSSTSPTIELSASPKRAQSKIANTSPQDSASIHSSPQSITSYVSGDTHLFDEFPTVPEHSSTWQETIPGITVSHGLDSDSFNFLSYLEPFPTNISFDDDLISNTNLDTISGPLAFGPQAFQPTPEAGFDLTQLLKDDNEEIEEIIRQRNRSSGSWDSILSRQSENIFDFSRLPGQPSLAPESPEMLAMRFDKLTCGILSVKDGSTENPWRTLIWPLAKETPALYHALFALTAFHSCKENPSLRVQGVKHMRQSMTCLRQQIQSMRADMALATSLALAFADTWDQNTRTCVQHLRGAKALMFKVLNAGLQGRLSPDELERIRFLYNTWTYMDVIARLTSLDDSGPQDFNPAIFHLPGDAVHEIDPLMGCAATLFPIIGRVARLVQKVRKCSSNSVSIVSQGMELKSLVEQWEPPQWFEAPEDPTSEVQHSIQVAHAYRWATLLYLHQAVPEIPSEPPEELAQRVLLLLATVPPSSRATIIQMFPLLAAGSEVDGEDDRKWVMDRWVFVQSRLMLGGIDRCLDVVREVWARRDKLKAQKEQHTIVSSGATGSSSVDPEAKLKTGFRLPDNKPNPRGFHARTTSNDQHERSMQGIPGATTKSGTARRGSALAPLENIEFERTVRSPLHWVNVMSEWGWEGKAALSPSTKLT
ncbi:hypothetical protein N7493_003940 [Penicillium malachiteum]|uniref:Zn(2)-C6 fungal-type domain-containing protein n=1 Tax=Penicillium malachiteum TaxID=1324776 RepID=A0AAD6HQP6_9EURO|nr:hypothetical protein N7493_003940 [Penicillium malachiteum]